MSDLDYDAHGQQAEVALAGVRRLLTTYREATCVTDGAPCSWHRIAVEIANEIDATIAQQPRWMAFPGKVPVCRDCGTDWQPVQRGECPACGSDAGPLPTVSQRPDPRPSAGLEERQLTDLNLAELRRVAEVATAVVGMAGTLGSGPWVLKGMPDEAADHVNAFDPPTVLRLLDLAQRAEADRAAVERVTALADQWERRGSILPANQLGKPHAPAMKQAVDRLRAALDPKEDQ